MTTQTHNRQPKGTPVGGQFAPSALPTAGVALLLAEEPELPPGVTEKDADTFSGVTGHELTRELHARTGWEVVVVSDGPDGVAGWVHSAVRTPHGTIVDVYGEHDEDHFLTDWAEWVDAWGHDQGDDYDDEMVSIYPATDHGWADGRFTHEPEPEHAEDAARVADALLAHLQPKWAEEGVVSEAPTAPTQAS